MLFAYTVADYIRQIGFAMTYFFKRSVFIFSLLFITSLEAQSLKQVSINDPNLGNRVVHYQAIDGFAAVEGDILIGKLKDLDKQGAVVTHKITGSRWEHGVIAYELDENLPFKNKLAILQAIDHWQNNTNLEFVELTSKNRDQYKDFISFIPAEGTTCSSYVGKQGGKQEINLAPRCSTMNTVHEIGHALGMWHEQSRSDRNAYIRIVWENIEDSYKDNFELHLVDGKDIGSYDYESIMHYGPYAFSKNGLKTIIPLVEGFEIGQRTHLSKQDIAAIQAMYPEI